MEVGKTGIQPRFRNHRYHKLDDGGRENRIRLAEIIADTKTPDWQKDLQKRREAEHQRKCGIPTRTVSHTEFMQGAGRPAAQVGGDDPKEPVVHQVTDGSFKESMIQEGTWPHMSTPDVPLGACPDEEPVNHSIRGGAEEGSGTVWMPELPNIHGPGRSYQWTNRSKQYP